MELLSNTNDILPSLLGWTPLLLGAALTLLTLLRRERATALINSVSSRTYVLATVASVILMTCVCGLTEFRVDPFGDSDRYLVRALNIIQYGVFGYGMAPTAWYPPGYSFLLLPAACILGNSRWAIFLTNVALLVAASAGVRHLLKSMGVPLRPANFAALVVILYPNRLLSTLLPASDIPFSLVFVCAFLCMTLSVAHPGRWLFILMTGLLGGIASLMRGNGLPLMIPLAAAFLRGRAVPLPVRVRNVGVMAAAALIVVAPWVLRNSLLFDRLAPVSSNLGVNLAIGNSPGSTLTYSARVDSLLGRPEAWQSVGGGSWNEAQRDSALRHIGMSYVTEEPGRFVVRGCGKAYHMMASDASTFGMLETYTNLRTLVFSIVPQLPPRSRALGISYAAYSLGYRFLFIVNNTAYYCTMFLTLLLLFRRRRSLSPPEFACLLTLVITVALAFTLFGISRFKEPLPLLALVIPFLTLVPRRDVPG
jgi:4-amino-4-deoxy-L-arabinose transferase-like glycosyltransferase